MSLGFGFSLPAYLGAGGPFAGASLVLDFTSGNQTLDPRITFTRSTTATRTNASGLIESVAINEPRFDYNPVTLAPKGLLIEEQRTNLLLYSEQFDNAAWNKTLGTVTVTVTADSATSPDGTVDADKVITANATGDHVIAQVASVISGTTYTQSWFLKAAELNWVQVTESTGFGSTQFQNINLSNGTVGNGNYGSAVSVTSAGNGWYRVSVTDTATATSASGRFLLALLTSNVAARLTDVTGNGTDGVFIYGGQLEAGAFATSYIPTVASQVTRAADLALMTGTNFSSWYNATEGTLLVDFAWEGLRLIAGQRIIALDDGTNTTYWGMTGTGANSMQNPVVIAGTTDATNSTPTTTYTAFTPYKQAVALALNNSVGAINGIAGTTDTAVGVPSGLTTARFAATALGGTVSNIWFRRIAYYNRRLTNAELQGITA